VELLEAEANGLGLTWCPILGLDGIVTGLTLRVGTCPGGKVARSSKRGNRRAASAFFFLLTLGLGTVAVAKIRQGETLTGAQFAAWTFLPLALLLGFTLPVRCRVRITRGTACGNDAYGLLFGCSRAAGHWSGKFRARLGIGKDISEQAPVGNRTAVMYEPAPGPRTMKITIEDSALTKCGSWATLVATVATIVGVIATFAYH
jgi:hypothetical protein